MWINYEPFNNQCYNTLWELARMLYDQYVQDNEIRNNDEYEMIQTTAIPYFTRWLFTQDGKKHNIDFTKPEWEEFIKQFIVHFLNREIAYTNAKVFRSNLIYLINSYSDIVESTANTIYNKIISDSATITENGTRNNTRSGETSRDSNTSTENSETGNTQNESSNTSTSNETGNQNSVNESNDNSKTNSNGYNRALTSDMPQSNVSASTVGNPDSITWTYASGLRDTIDKNDESSNSTINTNDTTTSERETQTKNTGNTTETRTNTGTTTNKATESGNTNETNNENYNNTRDSISPYELSKDKYEFFMQNMKKPIYILIEKCDKLFISEFVDSDRYGSIDWINYNNIVSKLYEVK